MKPILISIVSMVISATTHAANISVEVQNIKESSGKIGCALYDEADGFPMEASYVAQQWLEADKNGVTCTFDGIPDGIYAISVSHDVNENKETDTNLFGIPKEDWGVTNNVRPKMRAPTFDEAKFEVDGDTQLVVRID